MNIDDVCKFFHCSQLVITFSCIVDSPVPLVTFSIYCKKSY